MKNRLICIVLALAFWMPVYGQSTGSGWISIYAYCRDFSVDIRVNVPYQYLKMTSREGAEISLYLSAPYLVSGGRVYFIPGGVRSGPNGDLMVNDQTLKLIQAILQSAARKPSVTVTDDAELDTIIKSLEKDDKTESLSYNVKKTDFQPINAVIIDAGHGGKDPGAVGVGGVKEKGIILTVAKLVAEKLRADGKYAVFLTRDGDYFVTLEDRTKMCSEWSKKYNPIFVSIHANASLNKNTYGLEVYSLSDKASDADARSAEILENNHFTRADIEKAEVLYSIIADLIRDGIQIESDRMSKTVYQSIIDIAKVMGKGAKKAAFYVLKYSPVPAILIELGFVTNPAEVKKLTDAKYQKQLALGIQFGINKFVDNYNKSKGKIQ